MTATETPLLPSQFAELEKYVAAWALPTRQERYDKRLASSMVELDAYYAAVAPRAEEGIDYLNGFDIDDLPEPELNLLRLLYSLILVSYAVNVFQQPSIPDSGAAFFENVVEPAI